ncbi:MAG: imidazolonepropionase, partial [Acidobacteriota bacterium]|nr:imidazolonepropionase [Acidobacteriota bacterium]
MSDLAVVNCREVVTLAGPARPRTGAEMREIGVLADGAIRVRDGRIAAIGRRAEIARGFAPDTEVIDARGGV